MERWLKDNVAGIAVVIGLFALWCAASAFDVVDEEFMPSPGDVWDALVAVNVYGYKSDTLLGHLVASLGRLLAALAIAIVTAVPLGLLSGLNKHVRSALNPIIEFYRPLPPLAYYTLLVLWLGIGDASKITLLFLACFAPIYVACVAAVLKMPASYTTAARTLGANTSQVFKLVVLPYCLPDVFTGVRTAVGVGYSTLVAAEMVAATSGIGWMVLDASNWLRYDVVFVGIFVMGFTGIIIDVALKSVERRIVPWKGHQ